VCYDVAKITPCDNFVGKDFALPAEMKICAGYLPLDVILEQKAEQESKTCELAVGKV
jgi:hypothetical protein